MCRLSPLLEVASSLVALRPLSVPAIVPFGRITPMYVTVVLTCTPYSMPTPRSVTCMRGPWPSSGRILVPMVCRPSLTDVFAQHRVDPRTVRIGSFKAIMRYRSQY